MAEPARPPRPRPRRSRGRGRPVGSSRMTSGASRREGAGERDTRRSPAESVAHRRRRASVAAWKRADEGVGARGVAAAPRFRRGVRVGEPYVVGHRAAEDRRPLRDPGDESPPVPLAALGEVDAADGDATGGRLGQAQKERGDGALAGATVADERDRLAGTECEVEPVEDDAGSRRIRERDASSERRLGRLGGGAFRRAHLRRSLLERRIRSATASPSALEGTAPSRRSGRYSSARARGR